MCKLKTKWEGKASCSCVLFRWLLDLLKDLLKGDFSMVVFFYICHKKKCNSEFILVLFHLDVIFVCVCVCVWHPTCFVPLALLFNFLFIFLRSVSNLVWLKLASVYFIKTPCKCLGTYLVYRNILNKMSKVQIN